MFNTLTELFLQAYFLFNGILAGTLDDTRLLFDKLYKVFLLPKSKRDELYAATQREEVHQINTYGDYARVCRIQKYTELSEIDSGISFDSKEMIAVKGCALRKAKQFGFDVCAESTTTEVYKLLSESGNMGLVVSLCVLGFLQCEGIFLEKDILLGIKNLERAARWNNIEGLLLALYYEEKNRDANLDRLYTVSRGTLYEEVYEAAKKVYGAKHEARLLPDSKMLTKAFGMGVLKPDLYTAQYAHFIYSEILSMKDKERALLSGHKEAIAETMDLPLKLAFEDITFDNEALAKMPFKREKEQDKIYRGALNSDFRRDSSYRPLCICGDSEYLLKLYLAAMGKAFSAAHVERIDVADLIDYDLEPTKNNVFVRSCEEDRQNVYLLYCRGEIKDPIMSAVKNFLQSDKRKKFRLQHPGVVIDLSAVLPVCICDRQNARLLKQYCDIITLVPVSKTENSDFVSYILQTKVERYAMKNVHADLSAQKLLNECSLDRVESLIDKAVRINRGVTTLTITADLLKEISNGEPTTKTGYGFGGTDNESK